MLRNDEKRLSKTINKITIGANKRRTEFLLSAYQFITYICQEDLLKLENTERGLPKTVKLENDKEITINLGRPLR